MSSDRQVHARGDVPYLTGPVYGEVVRYGEAGKWYLEYPGTTLRRMALLVADAVGFAREYDMAIEIGLPGGRVFDALVTSGR